ncbi:hypothetical protein MBOT_00270 [Mycobacterium botniense]|uniref:Phosphoglycerate mutase n=1 Tax=Mycobacterium botniense TaxID=84962 RepID=A0A7I9XRN4_9MYCO|nr:hypothetical protein MBOT_00270 [Mycobacterium botniense]
MSGRLVLVRHAQSYGNLERRLDTLPPGTSLTPLGRDQARIFARTRSPRPAMVIHSVAARAAETAAVIGAELGVPIREVAGIHEVQVGVGKPQRRRSGCRVQRDLPAVASR